MFLNEQSFEGRQPPIDGYAPGGFRIQGRVYAGPVLLSAAGVQAWPSAGEPEQIDEARIEALLALAGTVDVAMIGMGAEMRLLPAAVEERLHEAGLGPAPMATPAACRSYNVALSEARRVCVALIPV